MNPPLKVLELASVLAGPSVGMFLAELGAEVLKIEPPQGDVTRSWRLPKENSPQGQSAYYAAINWGKKVLNLDLKTAEARAQIYELIPQMDIVLCNFKPQSAQTLGLDYAQVQKLNPRLIYAELSGFGSHDPRPAFDVVIQAEAGFMYLNGESQGPPLKMPVALMDVLAAHQLRSGILYALWQRERHGRGGLVRVSLLESGLAALVNQATNWLVAGQLPEAQGSLHPNIAPYGEVFYTAEHWPLVLAIGNDKQFQTLCQLLGRTDLGQDPRFENNSLRLQHRSQLQTELKAAFALCQGSELLIACEKHQVPLGRIRNMAQVMELEQAQKMLLFERDASGFETQRLASKAFDYQAFLD